MFGLPSDEVWAGKGCGKREVNQEVLILRTDTGWAWHRCWTIG